MAVDDAVTTIRFPIRLLTVAFLLTFTALAWFGRLNLDARRDAAANAGRLARIEELRGVIVHLDEVLTMSSRMAAATGDLRWEARYHSFEPQLDAAIKDTIRLGAGASNVRDAAKTDAANIKLVEMENRAFALIRAGRKEEAQAVLGSPEYEAQKKIYGDGIVSVVKQTRRAFDDSVRADQRIDLLSMIAAMVVGATSFVAWLSAARGVRRWRAQLLDSFHRRADAETQLRQAHGELEVRVRERTSDLAASNVALQEEIAERKRAERQLNIQYEVSRALGEASAMKEAPAAVLRIACETLNWDVGAFYTVDRRAGVMRFDDIWIALDVEAGAFSTASRQAAVVRGVGLAGRVWASGKPIWITDALAEASFRRASAAEQAGLHGACCFPILLGTEVSGVIELFSREIRVPDRAMLRVFTTLGSQLGQLLERKRLEEHLIQSQRLETVGRLAGGVAHEFNSILTTIIGQSDLLLGDLPAGSPLARNATEISQAAGRAATLTRQLLAYGRKQFLLPGALDLNRVIAGMEGMFQHLMGDGVNIRVVPAPGLRAVKADAGQIEQVIVNMAMNARDVMPNGGTLTLETANVSVDQESEGRYPELKRGDYGMLAITDTGTGMSEEVKARLFEPFFSTKGVGEGTGLGLPTCYGIVKQSGGHISVYSEPGRGTTFSIYLPQVEQQAETGVQRLDSPGLPRGTESILLVDDDPALREMAAALLRRLGYTVVAAVNGIEGLSLQQRRAIGHVDLLFTDVAMQQASGEELCERVRALYPDTRILLTAAYTENAIAQQGMLNRGVALLQKPFTPSSLARKLREVLDQPVVLKPDAAQQA